MKNFLKASMFLVLIIVTFLSDVIDMRELFVGGSTYVFYQFLSTSFYIKFAFVSSLLATVTFRNKLKRPFFKVLLLILFLLWLTSGRTIAFNAQNGKMYTGWFFFCFDSVSVCPEKLECERILSLKTKYEHRFLWTIKIVNSYLEETIFIGPFILEEYIEDLKELGITFH